MEYRDLDLRINTAPNGELWVALDGPAGQASGRLELPWGEAELPRLLDGLSLGSFRDLDPPEILPADRRSPPAQLGAALFKALFPAPLRSLLDQSLGSNGEGAGLRLRLRLDATTGEPALLRRLPWELLYRDETRDFLALSRATPVIRTLDVPRPARPLPLPRPLRILAVTSTAGSLELDLEQERRHLERAWAHLPGAEVVFLAGSDLDALRGALLEKDFHVLHFMGHGTFDNDTGEGALLFGSGRVSGPRLATALEDFEMLRLVVLNACKTASSGPAAADALAGVAAALVLGGASAVVAMQQAITDGAAIAFSRALYRRLAAGDPIEAAVVEGRQAIHNRFPGSAEWAIPVLFLRAEGGGVFEPPAEREEQLLARYLDWLIEQNRELELPALPGQEHRPRLPLEAVYVALRADFSNPHERAVSRERLEEEARRLENLLAVEELTSAQHYRLIWRKLRLLARDPLPWELDERAARPAAAPTLALAELLRTRRRLVILGDPGSGKSTLLRWLALRLAGAGKAGRSRLSAAAWRLDPDTEGGDELDLGPVRVPILLRIAAFAQARRARPGLRLAEFLGHLGPAHGVAARDPRGVPLEPLELGPLLQGCLDRGGAAVLLDGLDEIADGADRHEIAREIDAFLDAWVPEDGGNLAMVTSRIVGYHLAGLTSAATHLTLEPMSQRAAERFCRAWMAAAQRPASDAAELVAALAELRRRGAGELAGNPLLITVVALLFAHGRRSLPARRIELYELAVRVLIERWHRRTGHLEGLDEQTLLDLLVPLAAEIHRTSSLGTIGEPELARLLGRHLPTAQIQPFRRALRGEVGLLVERGEGVYGFLHLAFQEYLAARWLIAAADPLERLGAHLGDPRWREPIVMALGRLAESLESEPFEALLLRFLDAEDPLGRKVPRAALLLAAALPEMPACPEPVVETAAARLLEGLAADGPPALAGLIERAYARLLATSEARAVERVLEKALHTPGDAARVRAAARVIAAVGHFTPELAEALAEARACDAAPWPIERALRDVAARDPALLPAPRRSLRRTLGRKPELAARFLADPAWRRLGLMVYGGLTPEGGFALERCWRDAPELSQSILAALEQGDAPSTLATALRTDDTTDAGLARLALGEPLPEPTPAALAASLERIAALLAKTPVRLEPLIGPLRRLGVIWPAARWLELVGALLEQLPPADRRVDAVLELADGAPATARPALLADVWHLLFTPDAGGWHDPAYNLAVTLDVAGAQLAETPQLLAETLAVAAERPWSRDSAWQIARVETSVEGLGATLSKALAALEAIPSGLEMARTWALAVLAPLIAQGGVPARTITLAPRHGEPPACPAAACLLAHTGDLLAAADGDAEPLLDLLALLGVRAVVRAALAVLVPAAAKPTARDALTSERLPALLAALEDEDDLARCQAALVLRGDGSPIGGRRGVRRLGTPLLLELARAWLTRHEDAPRAAVVIRWAFETLEHDDPRVLSELAALTGAATPEAAPAELILGDVHAVHGEVWPVVIETLGGGPPKARRALLRSLCTLLARRRVPAERWAEIVPLLPALAAAMGEESVALGGPEVIVEAVAQGTEIAETAWQEVLTREPAAVRAVLIEVGERRLVGARSRERLEQAAERIAESPPLLAPLLGWLDRELARDVQGRNRDDHRVRDLLQLAAAAARRLPNTFFDHAERLPAFGRKLREAAEYGDWFPARQAALELLSLTRRASRHAVAALAAGLLDVAEVQQTALRSVARYRELDPELLPELAEGLRAASPAQSFATGRLLAALARNAHFEPELRRELETALAAAVDDPSSDREVWVLIEEPLGKHDRRRRLEHLGRLGMLLHRLVLETTGLGDLFEGKTAADVEEKTR